jgi:hypothetical protein
LPPIYPQVLLANKPFKPLAGERKSSMSKMTSQKAKHANVDLERALDNDPLRNDVIDSLYWDKITINVHDKTQRRETLLLDSIDGAAYAGQPYSKPQTLSLTQRGRYTNAIMSLID